MASFYKPYHQCDVSLIQKQKVTWFSQQFQFYKKKKEKSAKYKLLMVGTLDLSD